MNSIRLKRDIRSPVIPKTPYMYDKKSFDLTLRIVFSTTIENFEARIADCEPPFEGDSGGNLF